MDTVLLDTNIFSYILKRHTFAEPYRKYLEGKRLALSFMTQADFSSGQGKRAGGQRGLMT